MPEPRSHLVPILDHGVTLDRGDHVIVLLDALGPDDVRREIEEICTMLAKPQPGEKPQTENVDG